MVDTKIWISEDESPEDIRRKAAMAAIRDVLGSPEQSGCQKCVICGCQCKANNLVIWRNKQFCSPACFARNWDRASQNTPEEGNYQPGTAPKDRERDRGQEANKGGP